MKTITKNDPMTLKEFMEQKPESISKVKLAELLGAESLSTGYAVVYIKWPTIPAQIPVNEE